MKKLIVFISLIIAFSCTNDDFVKVYEYEWRWNVMSLPIMTCSGFDKDLLDVDVIKIELQSDLGETYNFTDFKISDNMLILEAPLKYQTEDFNDGELIRLNIKLICYN